MRSSDERRHLRQLPRAGPILAAQHPRTDHHDELLFIIIHQTKELWLKEIIHEVRLAKRLTRAGELEPAYKALARVSRIQSIMTQSWDVLATMTPADYLEFRGAFGHAGCHQSVPDAGVPARLKDASFLSFQDEGSTPRRAAVGAG
jgi:tryptophan 2,3-dioxygenase